jgi:hypothetical protein
MRAGFAKYEDVVGFKRRVAIPADANLFAPFMPSAAIATLAGGTEVVPTKRRQQERISNKDNNIKATAVSVSFA